MIEYIYKKDLFYANTGMTSIDSLLSSIGDVHSFSPSYTSNRPMQYFNVLDNVRKLNVFIGSNNSGKSRFMRRLFKRLAQQDVHYLRGLDQYHKQLSEFFKTVEPAFSETLNHRKILDSLNIDPCEYLYSVFALLGFAAPIEDVYPAMRGPAASFILNRLNGFPNATTRNLSDIMQEVYPAASLDFTPSPKGVLATTGVRSIYIPILRGIRNITGSDDDIYATKTQQDYDLPFDPANGLTIMSGYALNAEFIEYLLGDHTKRMLFRSFEEFLSKNFFDGQPLSIIPTNKNDKHITLKIGDRADRKIHELGDGLQSIIIFSWALFHATEEPTLIYIEEPENNMHPGLLRKFFEAFMTNPTFDNVQIFATSHSNHLIDLMHEYDSVSVFRFHESIPSDSKPNFDPVFRVEHVSGTDRSILDQLGVRYSSMLLTNCLFMVEGIGDRLILKSLLRAYMEHKNRSDSGFKIYTENLHYAFLEYAGSNITHYDFSERDVDDLIDFNRINANTFVIADGDGFLEDNGTFAAAPGSAPVQKSKPDRFNQLRASLAQRFQILPCREVENLLPPSLMISTLRHLNRSALARSVYTDAELFNSVTWDAYRHKSIGKFLETKFLTQVGSTTLNKVQDTGGMMAYKAEFAHAASKLITVDTITQFDGSVISLLDLMYNQIQAFNS